MAQALAEDYLEHPLAMKGAEVARLTAGQRHNRVLDLCAFSHELLDREIDRILSGGRAVAAKAILYSGGGDSTVLAHMFRGRATHAIHANTGIGIEQTRQFVRDTCAGWDLPLIEEHPPAGSTFRELVLDQGFPGPAHHWKMYQRLKERALRQARNQLVTNPRRQRVIFLAGRRRDESARRQKVASTERIGSIVFVSPLILWTKPDLNTYRLMQAEAGDPVPVNEVSDLLHMSGECLCGAFAHDNELNEIGAWFPGTVADIEALEADVLATGKHPEWKCRWGWGADKDLIAKMRRSGLTDGEIADMTARRGGGLLCSSCDSR